MSVLVRNKESAAIERIRNLIPLQTKLSNEFDENAYNVFVFGSYPTIRYDEGSSDIDIAVYTKDIDLYKKIAVIIEDYFYELGIETDLFLIDTSVAAPVYLSALNSQIQFTDYYPDELRLFKGVCQQELMKIKRSMVG